MAIAVRLQVRPLREATYRLGSPSFEGLRVAMDRRGEWGRFDPQLTYDVRNDLPTVTAFTLNATPVIELPQWTLRDRADESHRGAWDAMLDALRRHERNHHAIFERWLRALQRRMRREPPIPTDQFGRRWQTFNDELQDLQDRYDSRTDHGEREGVRLDDP